MTVTATFYSVLTTPGNSDIMRNTTILLLLSVAVAEPRFVQLLIIDEGRTEEQCTAPAAGWDSTQPHSEASSGYVVGDFRRHLVGRSFHQTPILNAISHGRIRFCTEVEEKAVLGSLAAIVVQSQSHPPPTFPALADLLLRGMAGPALIRELLAIEPKTDQERFRQQHAIEITETAIASHVEAVEKLPNIVEFRILDTSQVYLRADPDRSLYRFTAEGGLHDDHHFIDAETGELKPREGARARNEIALAVGEGSADGLENAWNVLRLKRIREDRAEFHHTGITRRGSEINREISIRPYEEVRDQAKAEPASPKTVMFRSDWKNGQRAEVTEDLVAMLRMGMTKDQVASILERPSRPSDRVARKGDSEEWIFTITFGRLLVLRFEGGKMTNIDGG